MADWTRVILKLNERDEYKIGYKYISVIVKWGYGIDHILQYKYGTYEQIKDLLCECRGISSIKWDGVKEDRCSFNYYSKMSIEKALNCIEELGCTNQVDRAYLFEDGEWYKIVNTNNIFSRRWKKLPPLDDKLLDIIGMEIREYIQRKSERELLEKIERKRLEEEEYKKWVDSNGKFLQRYLKELIS